MNPEEPARELEKGMIELRLEIAMLLYALKHGFRDPNQPNRFVTIGEAKERMETARKAAAGGGGLDRGL